jgi:subtilisin family serine protease
MRRHLLFLQRFRPGRGVIMKCFGLRGAWFLVCAAISALMAFSAVAAGTATGPAYAPSRVIVKLKPALPRTDADAVRSTLSAHVSTRLKNIDAEVWDIGALAVADAVKRLEHDPRVEFVEPDYIVHATAVFPDDPKFPLQWYLHNSGQPAGKADADIDAPEAWTSTPGAPVLVGVIDSGVDLDHEDLKNSIFTNTREIPANGIDDDGNGYVDDVHGWNFVFGNNDPQDDNGHGTHVSGIIAAPGNNGIGMAGVCWSARVIPLKFLNASGSGPTSSAILALQYAQRMGARLVNLSWGGFVYSTALRAALVDAGNHGMMCVAASGNEGRDASLYPLYPAGYALDNIVSVASTDRSDGLSSFSDYGLNVDLAAPGSDIVSAIPGNRYFRTSGTSMACAVVSGAACLLWSRAPFMTDMDMKAALLASVDKLPGFDGKIKSGGRLNLQRLMSGVDGVAPAPVTTLAVDGAASNAVRLAWVATGDDGVTGIASAYELRYATVPISANNFSSAKLAAGVSRRCCRAPRSRSK